MTLLTESDLLKKNSDTPPNIGFGVGLRAQHFQHILDNEPAVDWFEIISENFMDSQGWPKQVLRKLLNTYPVIPHGVSLSIGSSDPLNSEYLKRLANLADLCASPWVSDHLCWTCIGGHNSHDLLPLPYTEQSLNHISRRVDEVQTYLKRPLALENPSSYLSFSESTMSEAEFLARLCRNTDCGILLDVNNVYVCQRNHGWDALEYIHTLQPESVWQIHIAGHSDHGDHCIDTHIGPVPVEVWDLYLQAINHLGPTSTLLEWDQDIPEFQVLQQELQIAKYISDNRALPEDLSTRDKPTTSEQEAISNPIGFLIDQEIVSI